MAEPQNHHIMCKPFGGLWTSTYDKDIGSDWIRWCLNSDFSIPENNEFNCWLLEPEQKANIYIINSQKDADYLFDKYGKLLFEESKLLFLDFAEIKKDFDAVHLTKTGELSTRYSIHNSFYGWDCESTLWLRFKFKSVRYLGRRKYECK